MKRRPRIYKGEHGWQIDLPGYGFAADRVLKGFGSQGEAFRHLEKFRMFSGSASVERAGRPGRASWHELYPMPIVGGPRRTGPCGNCGGNHPTSSCPIRY